jgi:Major Facilitator Superfamily
LGMGVWTGSQAMTGYTLGLPGFFAMAYVKNAFGATYSQASWIFIASSLGAILWTPRIGHWMDHVGARTVLTRLITIGPLSMLGWLFVSKARWAAPGGASATMPAAVALMCLVSLVLGGFYAGAYLCQIRLTQAHTTPEGRTVAMGVHWSMSGLIASLGPLAAGWIKDHVAGRTLPPWHAGGAPMSYFQLLVLLHAVLAWGVALPLIRRIR